MSNKNEFGDFQTPLSLARRAVSLIAELYESPDVVIEPTCGRGSFLKASYECWQNTCLYRGFEINNEYVDCANELLAGSGINVDRQDVFNIDFDILIKQLHSEKILFIGNPPWVSNSDLSVFESGNTPIKSNFQGLKGLDARTGKSNFDIAEWILIKIIDALPEAGTMAMLCKTATARKVLKHFWKSKETFNQSEIFKIDSKLEFNVAVDACLLVVGGKKIKTKKTPIYDDLTRASNFCEFGYVDGDLVSDFNSYNKFKHFDGGSSVYVWRSGIKHDLSRVMELEKIGGKYQNGDGEILDIEDISVYPLLKSSDLGNNRTEPRRYIIVTQTSTGDSTDAIKTTAPKTWVYLNSHLEDFANRKSSIYKNRPIFSIFGIGDYSFSDWKIAISGMYKNLNFTIIPPFNGKPVMLDDTCYSIPCKSKEEAEIIHKILSSEKCLDFIKSLIFLDAKRPITVDVLKRLNIGKIAKDLGLHQELDQILKNAPSKTNEPAQLFLFL